MMLFESPRFLWLLLLLLPFAWWTMRRKGGDTPAIRYSDLTLMTSIPAGKALALRRFLPVLRAGALALLIIGLARPRYGIVERDVTRHGLDIFYCLDISGSMRAEDFSPNRLEAAKQLTAEMVGKRVNDRQGIVLFAGVAYTMCPLTFDRHTVKEFLQSVDFDSISVDGTAIGMGMARALKKLRDSEAESKVIILLTDGINNAGEIDPEQAAWIAAQMGVRVYAIGIGSRGIANIMVPTENGMRRVQMETTIDEELLDRLARATGGIYRRATSSAELAAILDHIDALETTGIEVTEYHRFEERMAWFVWPALAMLLMEILLVKTRFLRIP